MASLASIQSGWRASADLKRATAPSASAVRSSGVGVALKPFKALGAGANPPPVVAVLRQRSVGKPGELLVESGKLRPVAPIVGGANGRDQLRQTRFVLAGRGRRDERCRSDDDGCEKGHDV